MNIFYITGNNVPITIYSNLIKPMQTKKIDRKVCHPKYLDLFKQKLNERLWLPNTLVQLLFKKIITDLKREQTQNRFCFRYLTVRKIYMGLTEAKRKWQTDQARSIA